MKNFISATKTHIIFVTTQIEIYDSKTLEKVFSYPLDQVNAYFLAPDFLFIGEMERMIKIDLRNNFQKRVAYECDGKISSIFAKGMYLFIGTEKGVVDSIIYNDIEFKRLARYYHKVRIECVVGGNAIYVSDCRNKITEYPRNAAYYFISPKLYYGEYFFCVEGNKLYVKTENAFGLFVEMDVEIERIFFSEDFGYVFVESSDKTTCINMYGETMKDYYVNGAISVGDKLIWHSEGMLHRMELMLPEPENYKISFRFGEIKEKRVKCNDSEEGGSKYVIEKGTAYRKNRKLIDDNEITNLKNYEVKNVNINKNTYSKNIHSDIITRNDTTCNDITGNDITNRNIKNSNSKILIDGNQNYDNNYIKNHNYYENLDGGSIEYFDSSCMMPSAYRNYKGNLMLYSKEGYMTSIEGSSYNFITINYHDSLNLPIEIKDNMKSTMGCFSGNKFFLSNGEKINFNDEWEKNEPAKLIGINKNYVFVFNDTLKIFDFAGNIVHEIYISSFYTYSLSETQMAVFQKNFIFLINLIDFTAVYFPLADKVTFAAFLNNTLFLLIKNTIFKLNNNLLFKVLDLDEKPLAITNDYIITLDNSFILLPKPLVNYHKFTN